MSPSVSSAEDLAHCPRCGRAFDCGMHGEPFDCWCRAMPALPAGRIEAAGGCLCPECLAGEIAQVARAQQKAEGASVAPAADQAPPGVGD